MSHCTLYHCLVSILLPAKELSSNRNIIVPAILCLIVGQVMFVLICVFSAGFRTMVVLVYHQTKELFMVMIRLQAFFSQSTWFTLALYPSNLDHFMYYLDRKCTNTFQIGYTSPVHKHIRGKAGGYPFPVSVMDLLTGQIHSTQISFIVVWYDVDRAAIICNSPYPIIFQ